MYIINFKPDGRVLVSGNPGTRPVIGYSYTGYFDFNNISSNVKSWLDDQKRQIIYAKTEVQWSDEWDILEKQILPVL